MRGLCTRSPQGLGWRNSPLLADAAAARIVDGKNLCRSQGCAVDGHVVDEAGEGTVFVDLLADGEPVAAGVGDGAVPGGGVVAGVGGLQDAVVVDLAGAAGGGSCRDQSPLVERDLGLRILESPVGSVAEIELDVAGGHVAWVAVGVDASVEE